MTIHDHRTERISGAGEESDRALHRRRVLQTGATVGTGGAIAGCAGRNPLDDQAVEQQESTTQPAAEFVAAPGADAGEIQSLLDEAGETASPQGRAVVRGAQGVEYTIAESLEIPSNVFLETMKVRVADGANVTAIKSIRFDELTGSGKYLGSKGVPYNHGVRDVTVEGNRANNEEGKGIALYGKKVYANNVVIQNCAGDGFYSELAGHNHGEFQEDWGINLTWIGPMFVKRCGGAGFRWRGPTDGTLTHLISAQNDGSGFRTEESEHYQGRALQAKFVHPWGNGDDFYIGSPLYADTLYADGSDLVMDAAVRASNIRCIAGAGLRTNAGLQAGQVYMGGRGDTDKDAVVLRSKAFQSIGSLMVRGFTGTGVHVEGNNAVVGSGRVLGSGEGDAVVLGGEKRARHCELHFTELRSDGGASFRYAHEGNAHNTVNIGGWIGDAPAWHPDSILPDPTDSFHLDFLGDASPAVREERHHEAATTADGTVTVEHDLIAPPTFAAAYPRNEAATDLAPIGWDGDGETITFRFADTPSGEERVVFSWEAAIEGAASL
jgi:hypothetical protein